ncbi:MAG: amidohydrolase family protein [Sulfolobales archaeon]|nr:amidohydrolase family protein [Sulfolobales archaeon]MCX8199004.1 amidohydrolase family protein [Sulfolobales archaeon]MDW8169983.1 amidohydrolase family protein [Desulfurococcaceae archaeon]
MRNPSPVRGGEEGISGTEPLVINLGYLMYGRELDVLEKVHVIVEKGFIKEVSKGWICEGIDYRNSIALPSIVNSHIHLLDSLIQEACVSYDLATYVGSRGVKNPLIKLNFSEDSLKGVIARDLWFYSAIGDFIELPELCKKVQELMKGEGIEYISMACPMRVSEPDELIRIAKTCSGIGVVNPTNPHYLPTWALDTLSKISRDHVVAAHVGETERMMIIGGLEYLVYSGVRLKHVVHGVYLSEVDLTVLSENNIILVSCPSSNIWFTGRLPELHRAWLKGVSIAPGTDNAGCFKPDIWREANIIYSLIHSRLPHVSARELLGVLASSSLKALGLEIPWFIEEGVKAFFTIMNAKPLGLAHSWDKHAAILKRASSDLIRAVVKAGYIYST